MSKIELSEAYNQRNEASRKNSVYIDKVNALKKENKLLLPYKDQFDLKLKQEKEPLQAEVKKLTSENNILKSENSKLSEKYGKIKDFIDTVKNHYGEKYEEWYRAVFEKTKIKPKF